MLRGQILEANMLPMFFAWFIGFFGAISVLNWEYSELMSIAWGIAAMRYPSTYQSNCTTNTAHYYKRRARRRKAARSDQAREASGLICYCNFFKDMAICPPTWGRNEVGGKENI